VECRRNSSLMFGFWWDLISPSFFFSWCPLRWDRRRRDLDSTALPRPWPCLAQCRPCPRPRRASSSSKPGGAPAKDEAAERRRSPSRPIRPCSILSVTYACHFPAFEFPRQLLADPHISCSSFSDHEKVSSGAVRPALDVRRT